MFFLVGTIEQRDSDADITYILGQKARNIMIGRSFDQRNRSSHINIDFERRSNMISFQCEMEQRNRSADLILDLRQKTRTMDSRKQALGQRDIIVHIYRFWEKINHRSIKKWI